MQWHLDDGSDGADDGIVVREFTLMRGQRVVTGCLRHGLSPEPGRPVIAFGHGASGDRHQRPIPSMAGALIKDLNAFCLSIDGPVHGRRQVGAGGREAFGPEWRRPGNVDDMVGDWRLTLDVILTLPEVGNGPLGYFGLSMGTIYGAPLVGAERRIRCAVLGLMGISGPDDYLPIIHAAAQRIRCPVLFLMQLEDELFDRESCLALFDQLATKDKRLHANAGLHPEVPLEELRMSREFLQTYLDGVPEPRKVMLGISE
jgi:hypothetical protein